jgi:hypothetical protein
MISAAFFCEEIYTTIQQVHFLRQSIVVSLVTDWRMMLCFGAMFPPLGFIIAISIWKDLFFWRIALHRILRQAWLIKKQYYDICAELTMNKKYLKL